MNKIARASILSLIFLQCILQAQSTKQDSIPVDSLSDSTMASLQFYNSELKFKMNDSLSVRFDAPREVNSPSYYDPANVIPENPWELDYRESSYYTPRMVSDRMDQIMNRPRSDSFVPIPSLALMAASIALQMIDVDFSSQATALDYLQDQDDLTILKALWEKSPQTISELMKNPKLSEKYSFKTIERLLAEFSDLNMVKRKIIEAGQTQYFPAQKRDAVILAIENASKSQQLSEEEKTVLIRVVNFIKEE